MVYAIDGIMYRAENWLPTIIWVTEKAKEKYPDTLNIQKLMEEQIN